METQSEETQKTLKKAVQTSLNHNLLAKGLHEVCLAIDQRDQNKKPKLCILANNCDSEPYTKLVKALCKQNEVPIIMIPEAETLGEWIGICKLDSENNVRKRKKCSSVVVKKYAEPDLSKEEQTLVEQMFPK